MHPEKGRFYLPKNLNHASAKDRLLAYIIDFVAWSVVASILIGVLGGVGTYVSLAVYHLYFIVAHKMYGFTVGKQAMGIFIANAESTSVTWKQIVLRETVWKWVSAGFMMYGFIRLALMGEALHDKMSRTAVLTEKRKEDSFGKTAIVTVSVLVLFGSSVYYCITQTSFVGHLVVKRLAEKGHVVRGLKGNPKVGWSIDYWKGETPQGIFELRGIRFLYDFTSLYSVGRVHIKEIHVSSAALQLKNLPSFLQNQKDKKDVMPAEDAVEEKSMISGVTRILVDKVNLAKIRITRPGSEAIEVDRFYLSSLSLDKRDIMIKQAFIDASNIKLQVWDSHVDLSTGEMLLRSTFELRRGLHSSIIKPIGGKLEFHGKLYDPKLINAEAFDGRLRISYASNGLTVSARELTPSQYVRYDNALTHISAELRNRLCSGYGCLTGGKAYGSFYHTRKKFVFKDSEVWVAGQEQERMKLQLTSLWMNTITRAPIFSVSTDYTIDDFVSKMYFDKMYVVLTPEERGRVNRIRKDFFKYANRTLSSDAPKGAIPSREDFNK